MNWQQQELMQKVPRNQAQAAATVQKPNAAIALAPTWQQQDLMKQQQSATKVATKQKQQQQQQQQQQVKGKQKSKGKPKVKNPIGNINGQQPQHGHVQILQHGQQNLPSQYTRKRRSLPNVPPTTDPNLNWQQQLLAKHTTAEILAQSSTNTTIIVGDGSGRGGRGGGRGSKGKGSGRGNSGRGGNRSGVVTVSGGGRGGKGGSGKGKGGGKGGGASNGGFAAQAKFAGASYSASPDPNSLPMPNAFKIAA